MSLKKKSPILNISPRIIAVTEFPKNHKNEKKSPMSRFARASFFPSDPIELVLSFFEV